MVKKGHYLHNIGEDKVILVSIFKPDRNRSNTVLGADDLEMFLERREPKTILKTRDRTIYELLEGEVYMDVKEVDIEDRHLWDTELAVIDVIEKGKNSKVRLFKVMWFEPNTYELIIGQTELSEKLKELQSEAIFIRQ